MSNDGASVYPGGIFQAMLARIGSRWNRKRRWTACGRDGGDAWFDDIRMADRSVAWRGGAVGAGPADQGALSDLSHHRRRAAGVRAAAPKTSATTPFTGSRRNSTGPS